jgi:L-amino acid N-acyltransferase YncA
MEGFAKGQGIRVLITHSTGDNAASIRMVEKNGYDKCAHYRQVGEKFGQRLDVVAYQKILD